MRVLYTNDFKKLYDENEAKRKEKEAERKEKENNKGQATKEEKK